MIISPVGPIGSTMAVVDPRPRIVVATRRPSSSSPTRPLHEAVAPSRTVPMATFDSAPAMPSLIEVACRSRPISSADNKAMVSP